MRYIHEKKILKEVISRLEADSRIAEVLVTNVKFDEEKNKTYTTIKFLEYDIAGKPLESKYFTFAGNIIQFQSLVVRFDDSFIKLKDQFKGRSAYLFWKVFMLDGEDTTEYEIAKVKEIPQGYKLEERDDPLEVKFWSEFWTYALDSNINQKKGIKNAQIEAPGTVFVPGTLYTIKIEHDGGMRIDTKELPQILRGEYIPE
tara:strand:+ start:1185 stop:1787 length:603 start_codon:yes stop_codon:yes gene_type:complete